MMQQIALPLWYLNLILLGQASFQACRGEAVYGAAPIVYSLGATAILSFATLILLIYAFRPSLLFSVLLSLVLLFGSAYLYAAVANPLPGFPSLDGTLRFHFWDHPYRKVFWASAVAPLFIASLNRRFDIRPVAISCALSILFIAWFAIADLSGLACVFRWGKCTILEL